MVIFAENIGDVSVHAEAALAFGFGSAVSPVKIDTGKFFTSPVFCDLVVLLEDITEVVGMSVTDIFDAKVVYNKYK